MTSSRNYADLGADIPEFEGLCGRLGRAHSDATGEAFVTGSTTALDHLVLGVRYDGSAIDEVDWYRTRKVGRAPSGIGNRNRHDVFEWMAERTDGTLDTEEDETESGWIREVAAPPLAR